ncbi:MAG: quinolinate synthase NadA [Endomicrobiales bacterium]|nr:quinolinate synthase NadA [Endomicrobiales bacterium]
MEFTESFKVKIQEKITELKSKRNAVILAHGYQPPEVQDIADFTGDSLDLSRKAAATDAEVIVFCGVHFMAETAAIISPKKTVLLPDLKAGCPMANMITAEKLSGMKAQHPGVPVVAYVNTSAAVKAGSDICCTSANAVDIVNAVKSDTVIFVPDRDLGNYVSTKTGKKLILWDGFCPTHEKMTPDDVIRARKEHPGAVLVVHPECRPEVVAMADEVLSTSGMCAWARKTDARQAVIGTEVGIIHRLKKENPGIEYHPLNKGAACPNMKKIGLEKILWALEEMNCVVRVPQETSEKAKKAIDLMLARNKRD